MGGLIAFDEALRLLTTGVETMPLETVGLTEAAGRVLGEDIIALRSQPPAPLSAMDGYALGGSEAGVYEVVREIPAGTNAGSPLAPGQAARIFTGAEVPAGADRVVMQEDTVSEGTTVRVVSMPPAGRHIRAPGIDFAGGEALLRAGDALTPMAVALAAAGNRGSLQVRRKPRVAIFATGDELVEPGSELGPTSIVNSVSYGLAAQVEAFGGTPVIKPILPDQEEVIRSAFSEVLSECDVLVTIGGASVGSYDLVKPAAAALGAEMVFEKVAVRPGKPTWHSRLPYGPLVLGLPGNPASASVCAYLFLAPLIEARLGRWGGSHPWSMAEVVTTIPANGGRESFLRGSVSSEEGCLRVTSATNQDSSLLTPLARGNALIRRPINDLEALPGTTVPVLMINTP